MGKKVGKILGYVALAVAAVALVATGVGAFIGAAAVTSALGGISAATLMTISGAIGLGASLLAPKPKAPGISADAIDRLQATLNPQTARKALFGETALATDVMDQETNDLGKGRYYVHRFIVVAAHEIDAFTEIWFDEKQYWTAAGGVVLESKYLTVATRTVGNAGNAINIGPRMGATRRYTGLAYIHLRFLVEEGSPFTQIPTRVTIKGRGMKVYDPRQDSTQPGGSGAMRANDQSTWSFGSGAAPIGRNPALQLLTWLLGWYIQNPVTSAWKLSVGKGIPASRIDIASFMAAANICAESVTKAAGGTEPRYQTDGIVSEADNVLTAVDRWKTSMNATLDDVDGQIRIQILTNDLGSVQATFTENDVIGEFSWKPFEGLVGASNIIRGSFVDPSNSSLFQLADYGEVKVTSIDGIDRTEPVDYSMVQSRSQCVRLSKTRLQRSLYGGYFRALFQVTAWRVQKGDIVTLNFAPLGLSKTMRVVEIEHRVDGTVPLTLREENAAIYAWSNEEGAEVAYPGVTGFSKTMDPWYALAAGLFPNNGNIDANLLEDDTFGRNWTLNTAKGVTRVIGDAVAGTWPASSRPWVVEMPATGSGGAIADPARLPPLAGVAVPGRIYYIKSRVCKSPGAGTAGSLVVWCRFLGAAGNYLGEINLNFALNTLTNAYETKVSSGPAPAGTVFLEYGSDLTGTGSNTGLIRWEMPMLLDKEPGADITAAIGYGPVVSNFKFAYNGVAEPGEFSRFLSWKLLTPAGPITSGVTWSGKVLSGGFNGVTSTYGSFGMPVDNGMGTQEVASLQSDCRIEITAVYNSRTYKSVCDLVREVAAAPSGGTTGGGGSSGTASASKSSGFAGYSDTNWVQMGAVELTVPTGQSQFTASFNLTQMPTGTTNASSSVQNLLQYETPFGSNSWTSIGAWPSGATSVVVETEPGTPTIITANSVDLSDNVVVGSIAAGTNIRLRVLGRILSGTNRSHNITGSLSMTSP